jgi:hypothetical protein
MWQPALLGLGTHDDAVNHRNVGRLVDFVMMMGVRC